MRDFNESWHKVATQKRSQDAIDSILEAGVILAKHGQTNLLSARQLSEQSGYSTGLIYHYFQKIDDVYIAIFINRRRAVSKILISKIDQFPVDGGLKNLCTMMVNFMMDEWSRPNPKVLRFVLRQFFKRSREPESINALADVMIAPILGAIARDETGEMPTQLIEKDLRLTLRAIQAMIRSPFFEGDLDAGSQWHRNIVIAKTILLFSAKAEQCDTPLAQK